MHIFAIQNGPLFQPYKREKLPVLRSNHAYNNIISAVFIDSGRQKINDFGTNDKRPDFWNYFWRFRNSTFHNFDKTFKLKLSLADPQRQVFSPGELFIMHKNDIKFFEQRQLNYESTRPVQKFFIFQEPKESENRRPEKNDRS